MSEGSRGIGITFVDSRVSGWEGLASAAGEQTEVFLLDSARDGFTQIAEVLAGRAGIGAIHVFSHGSSGSLWLGSTALSAADLGNHATSLAVIGRSLVDTGDLLLYGCSIAGGDAGLGFIDSLAQFTGADVAASIDFTGAAALGGDWVLESSTGAIEAQSFAFVDYAGVLAAPVLSPAGMLDTAFSGDGKLTTDFSAEQDAAYGLAVQSDGKIVVAGASQNGGYKFALARYDTQGALDTTFSGDGLLTTTVGNGGGDDIAYAITIQPDGKILAAGTAYTGTPRGDFALARYATDGTLDSTFDTDGRVTTNLGSDNDEIRALALQPDGKIVVAGQYFAGVYSGALARYHSDGSLDTGFGTNGIVTSGFAGPAYGLALQSDGKIVVAGVAGDQFALARYDTNGALDTSFDVDGLVATTFGTSSSAAGIAIQPDGKIVAVGQTTTLSSDFAVARYLTDGSLDTSFDVDGKATTSINGVIDLARTVVLQSDGRILVAGSSRNGPGNDDIALVRYRSDGSLDTTFDGDGKFVAPVGPGTTPDYAFDLALQGDGGIVVAGASGVDLAVLRLTGSLLDRSAVAGTPFNYLFDVGAFIDPDGDTLTYTATRADNSALPSWLLWNPVDRKFSGTAAAGDAGVLSVKVTATDPGAAAISDVFTITVSNAPVVLNPVADQVAPEDIAYTFQFAVNTFDDLDAGDSLTYSATKPDDSPLPSWLTFTPATRTFSGTPQNADVADFSVKLTATDTYGNSVFDEFPFSVANVNDAPTLVPAGTLDTTFDGDGKATTSAFASFRARSAVVQLDGKIIVAGDSDEETGIIKLARFNTDGSADTSFDGDGMVSKVLPGFFNHGWGVALQSDGKVIVVADGNNGTFNVLLRYNTNGTTDSTFDADGVAQVAIAGSTVSTARALVLQPDGKIVVAGSANSDFAVSRFNANGTPDATFDGDGSVVTPIGIFSDIGYGVALQSDGRIVVAGRSINDSSKSDISLARYNTDGTLDGSFGNLGKLTTAFGTDEAIANAVAIQADGRIVVAGYSWNNTGSALALARYETDGDLDTTFGNLGKITTGVGLESYATGIAIQGDGKILVAGYNAPGGNPANSYDFMLARFNSDGSLDSSLSSDGILEIPIIPTGSYDEANAIALTGDGRVVLAGSVVSAGAYNPALVRVMAGGIPDRRTTEDAAFQFTFQADTFSEIDADDSLAFSATKLDGTSLASTWLAFNPATRTFTGSPSNADVGSLDVRVKATDQSGAFVTDDIRITVVNTNDAPTLNTAIPDQNATEDSPYVFVFSSSTFADVDVGDSFTYSASKPTWLTFNPGAREFSATPVNANVGTYQITVTGADSDGAQVSDSFTLTVANTNDAVTVANAIADKSNQINNAFTFTYAALNASGAPFSDVDAGEVVTYGAVQLVSGTPTALPAWLSFDTATRTFSGTPPPGALGTQVIIRLTATDSGGANAADEFTLSILTDVDTKTGTDGDDTLDGGTGADTMIGGPGDDIYMVDNAGDVTIEEFSQGTDLVRSSVGHTLRDHVENLLLTGTAAIDGTGNALSNQMAGNVAANRLDGRQGIDILSGGGGDDTYVLDNPNDLVIENPDSGLDTVEAGNGVAGTTFVLTDNVERITLTGADNINATGNAGVNTLTGNSGNNHLIGGDGNDTLVGGEGNDTLDGGLGADSMSGGPGNDTYVVDNTADTVSENPDEGSDLIQASVSWTLGPNTENLILTGTAAIDGTGNALSNQIIGNSGDNVLRGGDGDDLLKGERGVDTMIGGTGNDLYYVDNAVDVVLEAAGEGSSDQIYTSVNFTLPDHVERVQIVDVNALFIVGNGLNNFFEGSDGDDTFEGGGGDDVLLGAGGRDRLDGGEGNDLLDGGTGVDTLIGGAGDDTYVIDSVSDVLLEDPDQGRDRAAVTLAAFDLRQAAAVEDLEFRGVGDFLGTGNAANNLIKGAGGSDTLRGREGDDTLEAGAGDNLLVGGAGLDTAQLLGRRDDYQVAVVAGADDGRDFFTLLGLDPGDVVNLINRNNGRIDRLTGIERVVFLGDDLAGAADDVTVPVNREQLLRSVPVTGITNYTADLQGVGFLQGGTTDDVLDGLDGEDRLVGGQGKDTLLGGAERDTLEGGAGDDVLNGGSGNDILIGGAGNDTYVIDSLGDAVIENPLEGTADRVRSMLQEYSLENLLEIEILEAGHDADFTATGNARANRLVGGAGKDTLDGRAGADRLQGGLGDDTYIVDSLDAVVENANEGIDTIRTGLALFSLAATNPLTGAPLYPNIDNLTYTGTLAFNGSGNGLANTITGGAGNDSLSGAAGNDVLAGGDGNDALAGGVGDDTLIGGAGADMLNGGPGTQDVAKFAGSRADYAVALLVGDVVQLSKGDVRDRLIGVERVLFDMGTAGTIDDVSMEVSATVGGLLHNVATYRNDALLGTAANDTLLGLDGNDTLDGAEGDDTLIGGTGNDTYVVDSTGDVVTEFPGQGADVVKTALDALVLADHVETLEYTGSENFAGTGNASPNLIRGGAGNDTLDGGLRADRMEGGAGNDTYVVDLAANPVTGAPGDFVFEGATVTADTGGTDTVNASVSYTLGLNVENLLLTGTLNLSGTGNPLSNRLTGNSGNNVLNGLGGDDTFFASAGNDTYLGGPGSDTLNLTGMPFAFAEKSKAGGFSVGRPDLATLVITDLDTLQRFTVKGAWGATGTELGIESYAFSDATVTLAQLLVDTGSAFADTFTGTTGADSFAGLQGNDSYTVDHADDLVTENPNQGNDLVKTVLANYTLADNVERLEYTGSGDFTATGNLLPNTLTGGVGDDTLDGGNGADTLRGLGGNDTYVVDNASDVVFEGSTPATDTGGTDTVHASVSYALAVNVENLVLTGAANISGTGNSQNNTLTGNTGNNVLAGLGGDDTLTGAAGNDRYTGGLGADRFVFDDVIGNGVSTVTDFSGAQGDKIVLAASIYGGVAGDGIATGQFVQGVAALETDDFFVYNRANGQLFFDADGSDTGSTQVLIGTFANLALLSAESFVFG